MPWFDRVQQTSTSTGNSDLTLSGTIPTGFRSFSSVYALNDTSIYYLIVGIDGSGNETGQWEIGIGRITSTTNFQRTTLIVSSIGATRVTFTSAQLRIYDGVTASAATALATAAADVASIARFLTPELTTTNIPFQGNTTQYTVLTATNRTLTDSGHAPGRFAVVRVQNTGSSPITITWPAWKIIGPELPTTIAAGQSLRVLVESVGTTTGEVEASWSISLADMHRALGRFGTGRDGDATISSPLNLVKDTHYNNLTINGSGQLRTAGFRVFVRGRLAQTTSASPAIAAFGPTTTAVTPNDGGDGATAGTAGTAGPSSTGITLPSSSSAATAGGAGGATTGAASTGVAAASTATGGSGGAGGAGGAGSGGVGGASGIGTTAALGPTAAGGGFAPEHPTEVWLRGITLTPAGVGGRGGAGGGGDGTAGGGGGGGGAGAMAIDIAAYEVDVSGATTPLAEARGGRGGNGGAAVAGNRGGGAGGGGGGGGVVRLVAGSVIGALVDALRADGGNGGGGGAGFGTGAGGNGGGGGNGGRVILHRLSTGSITPTAATATAGAAGGTASGVTPGAGGVAGTARLSL